MLVGLYFNIKAWFEDHPAWFLFFASLAGVLILGLGKHWVMAQRPNR